MAYCLPRCSGVGYGRRRVAAASDRRAFAAHRPFNASTNHVVTLSARELSHRLPKFTGRCFGSVTGRVLLAHFLGRNLIVPGFSCARSFSNSGIKGWVSAKRLDRARSATTAMLVFPNILLMHHIAVHRYQHIESSFNCLGKQFAVCNSGPTDQRH